MKDYELTVLIHPDLEMNLGPAITKIKKLIVSNGGKIIKEESEGKKRCAYPIDGQDFAVYYFFDLQLPPEAPAKISSAFNISDEIMRYLLVRTDERKTKLAAKKAASAAEPTDNNNSNEEKEA